MAPLSLRLSPLLAVFFALSACDDQQRYATVYPIESMSQVIGGPAAAARPGDLMLENDRLRAVIHARHNMRSTFPIANGSLVDLDIQRPWQSHGVGKGADAFYELGPMVNLKLNSSAEIEHGACAEVGAAPCPAPGCARVSTRGRGENIIGLLGLLDLAIKRPYSAADLEIVTDYDVCPGEPLVRVATTARYYGATGQVVEMEELTQQTGLMDVLLGEHTGVACEKDSDCAAGESCDSLLVEIAMAGLDTKMRRCRKPEQLEAGVLAGDFMFFSAKVRVFIEGSGFDHESYIRSIFDTGGDIFSYPLAKPYVAGVGDGVSYAYFNANGLAQVPVFAEAFTAAMTARFACPRSDPECLEGKELRFTRFVSVGDGDVASALAGYYKIRGIPTGQVEGHVIDVRTQQPVSGSDVFVFPVPLAWSEKSDKALAAYSYEALVEALRQQSASAANPLGDTGPISHFRADTGLDSVPDGSFGGPLPEGRYLLVVRSQVRPASRLVPLRVKPGSTSRTTIIAEEPALLTYEVRDESGQPLPAKLTIGHCFAECARDEDCPAARPRCDRESQLCLPAAGYTGPQSCRPDQRWEADPETGQETCRCPSTGLLPRALGGHWMADNTVQVELSESGRGEVAIEPGEAAYQVIVSRGLEYEISRHFLHLQPQIPARLEAVLPRSVDSRGWISADFHVHGPNSVDSSLGYEERVRSYAAEGVELMTATDHDYLTDYGPTIHAMGLQRWLKSQTGLESSPLDYGHFVGFPLRFDENAEQNGAFHWRVATAETNAAGEDFESLPPQQIFQKLRELGSLGLERTVVFVAHFYDHFNFFGIDPWTLEPPPLNLTSLFNGVLAKENFSGEFDALEGFNGKNLDVIRRPTYQEIQAYNNGLSELLAESQTWSYERRQRAWGRLSAESQRAFLHRTPEEQASAIAYANPDFQCRCMNDGECGPGKLCLQATGGCIPACADDGACDQALVSAGREACLPLHDDPDRRVCQRVDLPCTQAEDCPASWGENGPAVSQVCIALDPAAPEARSCQLPCQKDRDCKTDSLRPHCDGELQVCTAAPLTAAAASDPCPTVSGTVDDWFQMLNHGVRRPLLGNSDSHGTYSTEAGIPRNYVRSSADLPQAIRRGEIADRVKAMETFPSYGPFVELSLEGQGMGSVVSLPALQVQLRIKVQSPRWFDVDRLEIYRNGELIREIDGRLDCAEGDASCIRVPNDAIVNYDNVLTDTPEQDSWYVVVAMGLEGKTLAPVYSSTPVPRLGMYELIQRLTPLLPPLASFRIPLSPSMTVVRPYAVTNPIFVDVDGDRQITPLHSPPSWATEADFGSSQQVSALTELPAGGAVPAAASAPGQAQQRPQLHSHGDHLAPGDRHPHRHSHGAPPGPEGHQHPHRHSDPHRQLHPLQRPTLPALEQHAHPAAAAAGGHDHRLGLGRMALDARQFERLAREGKITRQMLQRALDSLRSLSFRP